jgi:hypothetical protein
MNNVDFLRNMSLTYLQSIQAADLLTVYENVDDLMWDVGLNLAKSSLQGIEQLADWLQANYA